MSIDANAVLTMLHWRQCYIDARQQYRQHPFATPPQGFNVHMQIEFICHYCAPLLFETDNIVQMFLLRDTSEVLRLLHGQI